jgi:hypothetical protein
MDSFECGREDLIHPAFRARISQIATAHEMQLKQMTSSALLTLANIAVSLRQVVETTDVFSELACIVLALEPALTVISASPRRWNRGDLPTSAETDAVASCLRVVNKELSKALARCTGGNAAPTVSHAPCHGAARNSQRRHTRRRLDRSPD